MRNSFRKRSEAYGRRFDDMARLVPKLDKIRLVIPFEPRFNLDQIIKSVKDGLSGIS